MTLGPSGQVVGLEPLYLLQGRLAAETRVAVGKPAVFIRPSNAVHID